MAEKDLPARPNLDQYKKQAKELARAAALREVAAMARMRRHHPRLHVLAESELATIPIQLTDAQLVVAREHGFASWPKFAQHIEMLRLIAELKEIRDPEAAFLEHACVPRHTGHGAGTLDLAEMIRSRYPEVTRASIHTAAVVGAEAAVREFLARDPSLAHAKGGPHGWDALTHLCFSRYLRLDRARAEAYVATARALLEAGASANTGWYEAAYWTGDPTPRQEFESAIYGAAGVAQHPGVTRLLLEFGADPNDGETPYHVPESYDNTVVKILLESGKLNDDSLSWMAVRKADNHDYDGMKMVLEYGADPNRRTIWHHNALQHAIRRSNRLAMIELLLDFGADPALKNEQNGLTATEMAARRGRADVLDLFEKRGIALGLTGREAVIAACARADREAIERLVGAFESQEPGLRDQVKAVAGWCLAEFAGVGNLEGMRCLLELGADVGAAYGEYDPYFDITKESRPLHVAAWRGWPATVCELIAHGADVRALDGNGRSPLMLAVKACVDSYWTERRTPESVRALLQAGATVEGVEIPCGYEALDALLVQASLRG